jgi:hypothetical protein
MGQGALRPPVFGSIRAHDYIPNGRANTTIASPIREQGKKITGPADGEAEPDVDTMSNIELKAMITRAGLFFKDCSERTELKERAREALVLLREGPPGKKKPEAAYRPSKTSPEPDYKTANTTNASPIQEPRKGMAQLIREKGMAQLIREKVFAPYTIFGRTYCAGDKCESGSIPAHTGWQGETCSVCGEKFQEGDEFRAGIGPNSLYHVDCELAEKRRIEKNRKPKEKKSANKSRKNTPSWGVPRPGAGPAPANRQHQGKSLKQPLYGPGGPMYGGSTLNKKSKNKSKSKSKSKNKTKKTQI